MREDVIQAAVRAALLTEAYHAPVDVCVKCRVEGHRCNWHRGGPEIAHLTEEERTEAQRRVPDAYTAAMQEIPA